MPRTREEFKEALAVIINDAVVAHQRDAALEGRVKNLEQALQSAQGELRTSYEEVAKLQEELRKSRGRSAALESELTGIVAAQQSASEAAVRVEMQVDDDKPRITVRHIPFSSRIILTHTVGC
jgi:chromosome segregation ATPase